MKGIEVGREGRRERDKWGGGREEGGWGAGQSSPELFPRTVTLWVGPPLCRGARKPWEILASIPKGYEVIMEHLLQRLTPQQKSRGQEPSGRTEISPLIVRGPEEGPGAGRGRPGAHPRLS